MSDRKMIKWLPFDAVIDSNKIVNEIEKKKREIKIPILSEDNYIDIQNNILLASQNNLKVKIKFYSKGTIITIIDTIKNIDITKKRITTNSYSIIYFNQITDVSI